MRDRRANLALVVLCVLILILIVAVPGQGVESVDVRTYMEMTRGIVLHGLPYFDNGPIDRFTAMVVPWNVPAHGHLWGVYAPVYPYFSAPFLALGGVRLVTAVTTALAIPIAIVTFRLARRVVEDERYAAFAAFVTTLSTPVLAKAVETAAYPLAVLFMVAGTATTVEATVSLGKRRLAFAAASGVLFALAAGTHLLCLPACAALMGALAVADATPHARRGPALLDKTIFASFWPTRATIASALVAGVVMAICTIPVACLNKLRFGSYNPFTYGPTPWLGSDQNGVADQTISGHLRFGLPVLAVAGVAALALALTSVLPKGRWLARAAIAVLLVLAFVASSTLRDKATAYGMVLYGLVVDQSKLPLGPPYWREGEGFGNFFGAWVVKSTLQCTPMLILLFALTRGDSPLRNKLLVTLAPCAGLFGYLMLRANLPLPSALGYPWVYIRYTLPALPMAVVGATVVVREIGPTFRQWLVGLAVAIVVFGILQFEKTDMAIYRQVLILVVPVVSALAALVAVWLRRRGLVGHAIAACAVAAACGVGLGIGMGHDLRSQVLRKVRLNESMDAMSAIAPSRFALVGAMWPMDVFLALENERDVQYAALELTDMARMRPLLEHWFAERRPVFYVMQERTPEKVTSPWTDIDFEAADGEKRAGEGIRIYRIVKKAP